MVFMFGGISNADLNDGLVAYYPFNGNANDESGNGYDAELYNGIFVLDGRSGTALKLDGDDDYAVVHTLPAMSTFTQSIWFKKLGPGGQESSAFSRLFERGYDSVLRTRIGITQANEIIAGRCDNVLYLNPIGQYINMAEWYNIVQTYDGQNLNYYLNGVLIQRNLNCYNKSISGDLYIGCNVINTDPNGTFYLTIREEFEGIVDEVRVYNRALSECEIKELYTGTPDPNCGLVAYYPFNGNAHDESGNGNDGTVNGATLTTDKCAHANSAHLFDGQNDYIKVPFSDEIDLEEFTLAAWAKADSLHFRNTILARGEDVTEDKENYRLAILDGKFAVAFEDVGSGGDNQSIFQHFSCVG